MATNGIAPPELANVHWKEIYTTTAYKDLEGNVVSNVTGTSTRMLLPENFETPGEASNYNFDFINMFAETSNSPFKNLWISEEYMPVKNTPTIVNHGLDINPLHAKGDVLLKCVEAHGVCAVGDFAISLTSLPASQVTMPMTPVLTATTIQINTGGVNLYAANPINGSYFIVILESWRYIFRVWY